MAPKIYNLFSSLKPTNMLNISPYGTSGSKPWLSCHVPISESLRPGRCHSSSLEWQQLLLLLLLLGLGGLGDPSKWYFLGNNYSPTINESKKNYWKKTSKTIWYIIIPEFPGIPRCQTCIICNGTWTSISPTYILQDNQNPYNTRIPRDS